jgi:heme exporter protein D
MTWGSLDNFLAMGGFGLYVWGSYAVTLVLMIAEIVLLARRRRAFLADRRARGLRAPEAR